MRLLGGLGHHCLETWPTLYKEAQGFGLFFEADLGSLPFIWLHPQVDPREPIYRLVTVIFENTGLFTFLSI
jgi:hypothetical protein